MSLSDRMEGGADTALKVARDELCLSGDRRFGVFGGEREFFVDIFHAPGIRRPEFTRASCSSEAERQRAWGGRSPRRAVSKRTISHDRAAT
jgi:hypothetical protein